MNARGILQQRLFNQYLSNPIHGKPEDVVAWLGAVQSQDYSMAKWAVGLRCAQAKDEMLESALNEGKILRPMCYGQHGTMYPLKIFVGCSC
jgi:hypothetical protein